MLLRNGLEAASSSSFVRMRAPLRCPLLNLVGPHSLLTALTTKDPSRSGVAICEALLIKMDLWFEQEDDQASAAAFEIGSVQHHFPVLLLATSDH